MRKLKKPIKTHSFNGHKYTIRVLPQGVHGVCDQPGQDETLLIATDPNTCNGLITAIHEAMHASDYHKKEADVDRCSKDIGRFLWRLGYRIKEQ